MGTTLSVQTVVVNIALGVVVGANRIALRLYTILLLPVVAVICLDVNHSITALPLAFRDPLPTHGL